jgi:hypothetical protein
VAQAAGAAAGTAAGKELAPTVAPAVAAAAPGAAREVGRATASEIDKNVGKIGLIVVAAVAVATGIAVAASK